jgi:hypothetical protein
MTAWLDRLEEDPSLKAHLDAEIARAVVELASLKVEVAYWKGCAQAATKKIRELEHRRGVSGIQNEPPMRARTFDV